MSNLQKFASASSELYKDTNDFTVVGKIFIDAPQPPKILLRNQMITNCYSDLHLWTCSECPFLQGRLYYAEMMWLSDTPGCSWGEGVPGKEGML